MNGTRTICCSKTKLSRRPQFYIGGEFREIVGSNSWTLVVNCCTSLLCAFSLLDSSAISARTWNEITTKYLDSGGLCTHGLERSKSCYLARFGDLTSKLIHSPPVQLSVEKAETEPASAHLESQRRRNRRNLRAGLPATTRAAAPAPQRV